MGDARAGMNSLDETAEHRSGTYLNIRGDALRRKTTDDGLPLHRRGHLSNQRFDSLFRRALRLTIHVRDDRDARLLEREPAQFRLEPLLGRLHERAVERRTHRQRYRAPGAKRLRS